MHSDRIALVVAGAAALGLVVLGASVWRGASPGASPAATPAASPAGPPNILVIDVDTFSYDHVSAQRDGASTTPRIDGLAARGVRFTHAVAHAGWTLPAIGSLLTGRLPVPLRLEGGIGAWHAPGTRDFPQILSYYGYTGTAFWGVTLMQEMGRSISPGFATHQSADRSDPSMAVGDPAAIVANPPTEQVTAFLSGAPTEPFLAYVHEIDLHRAMAFDTLDADDPLADPSAWVGGQQYPDIYRTLRQQRGDAAAQEAILAHYDRMVTRYDQRIGQILDALDASGLAERTVVVLTSDHGDDFFLHANGDHGLLYDSTIRVPLIIADPRASARGKVVDDVVQHVDLAPTLLELAGVPADAGMDGRSLASYLNDGDPTYTPRPVFSLSDACHASYRADGLKLILRDHASGHREWFDAPDSGPGVLSASAFLAAHPVAGLSLPDCTSMQDAPGTALPSAGERAFLELFDLAADPDEQHNLAADRPEDVARMLEPLLRMLQGSTASATGGAPMTPEQVEAMKAQGYWGFVTGGAANQP